VAKLPQGKTTVAASNQHHASLALLTECVAWLMSRPLEVWYDETPIPVGTADAIVVLAGSVNPPLPHTPYALVGRDSYVRLQRAVWLFKNWKPLPILFSGGGVDGKWYAAASRHVLESEAVPPEMIWTESQSRSTYENALFSSEILRQRNISRIALIVDASSMPRAAACFRKLGLEVLAVPARYSHLNYELDDFVPTWQAIESNGETLHEIVGLVWYKLRGRI
jgi:uncharacterized SAM-binding protein YcdF (DUF218 family)